MPMPARTRVAGSGTAVKRLQQAHRIRGDKITSDDRQQEIRLNDGAGERVPPKGGADVAGMGGRWIIPQLSFGLGVSGIWRGPPSADP